MVRCRYTHRNSLELLLDAMRRWLCVFHVYVEVETTKCKIHTHALRMCVVYTSRAFFISFPVRCRWLFLHHSFHRVCVCVQCTGYAPKMIWVNRRSAQYRVCLFMHLQRCYRSIFFNPVFSIACVARFVGSFLPNNGITLNFQPFFLIQCLICFLLSCCSSISYAASSISPCHQGLCFIINFGRQNRT